MKDETTLCYEEKRKMKIKWNADNAEFLNYIFLLAFCISDYFFENKTVTDILCIGMGVTMIPIIAALHKNINVWPENKRRSKMWSCVFSLILTTALIVCSSACLLVYSPACLLLYSCQINIFSHTSP